MLIVVEKTSHGSGDLKQFWYMNIQLNCEGRLSEGLTCEFRI